MTLTRTLTIAAAIALATSARAAEPAAAGTDVETLRAEVQKLREELEAMKAAPAREQVPAANPVPASSSVSSPVSALEGRLDLVEIMQRDAVVAGDIPGSFRIPGT
jgi:outer membrane murein-binding lipoprotein Lpp